MCEGKKFSGIQRSCTASPYIGSSSPMHTVHITMIYRATLKRGMAEWRNDGTAENHPKS